MFSTQTAVNINTESLLKTKTQMLHRVTNTSHRTPIIEFQNGKPCMEQEKLTRSCGNTPVERNLANLNFGGDVEDHWRRISIRIRVDRLG